MKELRVEVPEGYEIDKENSTFECIKFKPKGIKTWNNLCKAGDVSDEIWLSGYCLDEDSNICMVHRLRVNNRNRNIFLTEKEAKSARAAAMISQLMPYYGGAITDEEWDDKGMRKFVIIRRCNRVFFDVNYTFYEYLAFYTEEQRDSFYKNNEQLVKEYLMID